MNKKHGFDILRLSKKDRDLLNANNHANALEDEVRELSSKMKKLEQDRQRAQDELRDALPELDALRKKLADLKRVLDDEQLKKADLENQCARLEEDLKFKLQLLEKELTEVNNQLVFIIQFFRVANFLRLLLLLSGQASQRNRNQRNGRQVTRRV